MSYRICRVMLLAGLASILPGIFGCPAVVRSHPRGHVLQREEPVSGQEYQLYVPSNYFAERAWPVVVTCHGTQPFDSAKLQIREWMDLAEQKGLIVVAPQLRGTHARTDANARTVAEQIDLQRDDEMTILSAIDHVKAAYHVDEGRIFLTGWSAGSYAVLWTGLSHPEIFRALAVRQGNFDPKFFEPLEGRLNRHQSVLVFYGQVDLLRGQAEACIRWLKERGMTVFADEIIGAHRRTPDLAYKYFASIADAYPWLVARWEPCWAGNPLTARFRVKTDPTTARVQWDLGDGQTSTGATVDHKYGCGGTYKVTVRADFGKKGRVERTMDIAIAPAMVREAPASGPAPAPGK